MELRSNQVLHNKYIVDAKIGEGSFGKVYKGIEMATKNYVAIKQIPMHKFQETPKLKQLFQSEIKILKTVHSENVVGFVDYFENSDSCFLLQEFCDSGDLEQYLKRRRVIPESEAIEFFKQILNGFKGLHEINAVHRDLKAANILIHNKHVLKIADLGFGKIIKEGDMGRTVLGTSLTMAPEVLENKAYGLEVDVYSLGVIFYQILFGVFPYNGRSDPELLRNIKTTAVNFKPNSVIISEEMKDMLSRMICYSREKRISWKDLYNHKILNEKKKGDDNLSLAHLHASQIQIKNNQQFYMQHTEALQKQFANNSDRFNAPGVFDQQIPNNPLANQYQNQRGDGVPQYPQVQYQLNAQQQQQQQLYQQQQFQQQQAQNQYQKYQMQPQNVNIPTQDLDRIKQEAQNNQAVMAQINKIAERYLHYRNVYGQLIKTVNQAHSLPNTRINTFVPIFLIQKKLYLMNRFLYSSLKDKQNVFKMNNFEEFLKSKLYQSCLQHVQEEEAIIKLYFNQLRYEVQQILVQNQVHQNLKAEVETEELQNGYQQLLKQTILNYQMSLSAERHRFSPNDQRNIFIHEVQVLEMVNLDHLLNTFDFDFEKHNEEIRNTPHKDFDDVIGIKQTLLFD